MKTENNITFSDRLHKRFNSRTIFSDKLKKANNTRNII